MSCAANFAAALLCFAAEALLSGGLWLRVTTDYQSMFPNPAAFNFRHGSAQLGWERTRRRAALFGRAIAGVPLPGPGLDEKRQQQNSTFRSQ